AGRDIVLDWAPGDALDVSAIDASTALPGHQSFQLVGETSDPGAGQLGYYHVGSDTIVVGDTGTTTFEIDLANYAGVLGAGDFVGVDGGERLLPGCPAYDWYHGCSPTSAGMLMGYWDLHGYGNLFDAQGWAQVSQTSFVEDQISSPAHNAKYDSQP